MSTFTKEQLIEKLQHRISVASGFPESEKAQMDLELARIALASLEAEPVCYLTWHQGFRAPDDCEEYVVEAKPGDKSCDGTPAFPVYSAPPAPAPVSDEDKVLAEQARAVIHCLDMCGVPSGDYADNEQLQLWGRVIEYGRHPASVSVPDGYRLQPISEYDAMCAAMLQGADGNSPVIPDGWVMVQVEPTEDMIVHGFESEPDESFSDEKEWEAYDAMSGCQQAAHRAKLCWAAMIAAAPKPDVR